MNILLIHNRYQQEGGEDAVFEAEAKLLESHRHRVKKLLFDNKQIVSVKAKFLAGLFCIYNPRSAKIIERKINQFKPDVIHVHNFFPLVSPSVFYVAKRYNIPVVVTLHNFRFICPNAILFRNDKICERCINKTFPFQGILRKCYRDSFMQTLPLSIMIALHKILKTWQEKVDKFIVLTEFQKRKFLESSIGIPENKFVVKPNFVKDHGIGANRENFFLYVGRLSKEKGIEILLKATSYFNFKLKIAGHGPLKNKILTYALQNKNVEYLGFKTKEEVINLMKQAKALIFPSLWYEGFPMVLVEALSTGTPVITSNIGSQALIIEHEKTGLHFKAGDPEDLAEKIKMFVKINTNPFYENARKTYLKKYTPDKNYEQLVSIYEEVMNASKKKGDKH